MPTLIVIVFTLANVGEGGVVSEGGDCYKASKCSPTLVIINIIITIIITVITIIIAIISKFTLTLQSSDDVLGSFLVPLPPDQSAQAPYVW